MPIKTSLTPGMCLFQWPHLGVHWGSLKNNPVSRGFLPSYWLQNGEDEQMLVNDIHCHVFHCYHGNS